MRSLGVRIYGDDVLRKKGEPVEEFDEALAGLIRGMVETMIVEEGVGLAAPQVGVSRQVAVVNPEPDNPDTLVALVNPRIVSCSDRTACVEEGCLSVPGVRGKVTRPAEIEVEYQDEGGERRRLKAEGLVSRIIQHEIDHLNGVLFVDRISLGARALVRGKLRELARHDRQG
ncbi:MAG: peptide deformylase [Candidatus Krumholzibacteria bacterium]|nr:peptide deformylase [Candidatus Krumholzibacteria bacterium]